eukprot:TRINITY_DN7839_c0_g1_i1.p1 TRINITY_DN7839_c0_g1~~TRINITY_DN7839_c0_g1_i1.p1  ORF type:complete len:139 (+),score=50.99 TRINITY_DN7839_c0_g1_i1:99-515(+)
MSNKETKPKNGKKDQREAPPPPTGSGRPEAEGGETTPLDTSHLSSPHQDDTSLESGGDTPPELGDDPLEPAGTPLEPADTPLEPVDTPQQTPSTLASGSTEEKVTMITKVLDKHRELKLKKNTFMAADSRQVKARHSG